MANIDRLIGADATLASVSFGTNLNSGVMTSGLWYKIATISGTAIFPTGYQVGDMFLGNGQTLNAGNTAALGTETVLADATSFKFDFSAAEVDVTTLNDNIRKYRKGKTDLTGTIEGLNLISEMRKANSVLNRFIRVVTATSANVSTLNPLSNSALYIKAFLQDDTTTSGESQVFLFGQVELYGYSLGAAIGDAQSYSSGIRFNGSDPIVVVKDN